MSHLVTLPAGCRGLDANAVFSPADAHATFAKGYRFVGRYIPRREPHAHDLSRAEIKALHAFGLAVVPIQHVERDDAPWWVPSRDKGHEYGTTAVEALRALDWPIGGPVVLDLEGCAPDTPRSVADAYVRGWLSEVNAVRFKPMVYFGFQCILRADDLWHLPVDRYIAAYNADVDQYPTTRGICMKQHAAARNDKPLGMAFDVDVDIVQLDHLGGLPTALAPDEWAVA